MRVIRALRATENQSTMFFKLHIQGRKEAQEVLNEPRDIVVRINKRSAKVVKLIWKIASLNTKITAIIQETSHD